MEKKEYCYTFFVFSLVVVVVKGGFGGHKAPSLLQFCLKRDVRNVGKEVGSFMVRPAIAVEERRRRR